MLSLPSHLNTAMIFCLTVRRFYLYTRTALTHIIPLHCCPPFTTTQQPKLSFPCKSGRSQVSAHSSFYHWPHFVAVLQEDSALIFLPSHIFLPLQRASLVSDRGRHSCLQSTSSPIVVSNFEDAEI